MEVKYAPEMLRIDAEVLGEFIRYEDIYKRCHKFFPKECCRNLHDFHRQIVLNIKNSLVTEDKMLEELYKLTYKNLGLPDREKTSYDPDFSTKESFELEYYKLKEYFSIYMARIVPNPPVFMEPPLFKIPLPSDPSSSGNCYPEPFKVEFPASNGFLGSNIFVNNERPTFCSSNFHESSPEFYEDSSSSSSDGLVDSDDEIFLNTRKITPDHFSRREKPTNIENFSFDMAKITQEPLEILSVSQTCTDINPMKNLKGFKDTPLNVEAYNLLNRGLSNFIRQNNITDMGTLIEILEDLKKIATICS